VISSVIRNDPQRPPGCDAMLEQLGDFDGAERAYRKG
jgi:Flp pilus assembly protein TadD